MDDIIKIVALVGALVGLGVGSYAGITVVSLMKRRFEARFGGPSPEELESIHARLATVEALEARVNELEERVDFAERLVANHHDSERLSSGQPLGQR